MSGCLLAFDTSTEIAAVALRVRGVDHTRQVTGGAQASMALLPAIQSLLDEAAIGWGELDAIGFGSGPGAFTGLRTSCAVAQGLGFGLGRPLLALDSLMVVAEDARQQVAPGGAELEVGVAMDARMNEVYAGRYSWQGGRWQVLAAPALYTLSALAAAWAQAPACVAGSALAAFGERLGLPKLHAVVPSERNRAAALLQVAQQAFDAGAAVDAADALPMYLRDKVALTTREREAAREAVR